MVLVTLIRPENSNLNVLSLLALLYGFGGFTEKN